MSKNEITDDEIKLANKFKFNCIICPKCKENAKLLINNYKFGFNCCKNRHNINDILIKDFDATQCVNDSKISCQKCNKTTNSISYNNNIYLCFKCNQNLCESCKSIHDKTHNIINYKEKYFFCDLHFESYNSYCSTCKKDLCQYCEFEHTEHDIIYYDKMISNISKGKEEVDKFFAKKEHLKNDIKDLINKLENLINSIDNCFYIYENIVNNNENNRQNYFSLQNINEINKLKDSFISEINEIINEKNIFNKVNNMIDLYNKMNLSNDMYFKAEHFNDKKYNLNDIDIPHTKNENEKSEIINDASGSVINKKIEINSDYFFISEKNDDDNYKDYDITKMKKLLTLTNKKLFFNKIYVLKDGRIIIHNQRSFFEHIFLCFIFDLKNDKCLSLNTEEIEDIENIFEMDDGLILVVAKSKIMLINIKEDSFEIIQSLKTEFSKIFKLTNEKYLTIEEKKVGNIFIYKNKNLIFEKQISLKSIKELYWLDSICTLNEKELITYFDATWFTPKKCIYVIDLEKDKKIISFKLDVIFGPFAFDVIYDKILIAGSGRKVYVIDLIIYSIKLEAIFENKSNIHSIIALNEKQFIVGQFDFINQFELDKDYKFKLIYSIALKSNYIYKYPKSRFLIRPDGENNKTLFLYG